MSQSTSIQQLITSTAVQASDNQAQEEVVLRDNARNRLLDGRYSGLFFGTIGVLIVLFAWQILAVTGVVDINISSDPIRVAETEYHLFASGQIFSPLGITATEVAWGLVLIVLIGIPLGLLIGRIKVLRQMTEPILSILNSVPYVMFLPLIIFWFGLGLESRVLVVVWAGILPLVINTSTGVRNVDKDYLRVGKVFMVSKRRFFVSILLPAALPYILTGLRLAVARALVGAIVVEFFLGSHGLGFFVQNATASFQMSQAMAGIILMAVLALSLVRLIGMLEKRTLAWSRSD